MRGRSPTRGTLHELTDKIEYGERALETLERRRDVLIMELQDVLDQLRFVHSSLDGTYEEAQQRATAARAMEGAVAMHSAARARSDIATIRRRTRNVMGVKIPELRLEPLARDPTSRGYGLIGTSARIDETAAAYEILLDRIVRTAEVELQARLLLDEVAKAMRRVNALEHKVLPELRAQRKQVRRHLEERERQEIATRKWAKEHVLRDDGDGERPGPKAGGWTRIHDTGSGRDRTGAQAGAEFDTAPEPPTTRATRGADGDGGPGTSRDGDSPARIAETGRLDEPVSEAELDRNGPDPDPEPEPDADPDATADQSPTTATQWAAANLLADADSAETPSPETDANTSAQATGGSGSDPDPDETE